MLEGCRAHAADGADGVPVLLDEEFPNRPDVPCPPN